MKWETMSALLACPDRLAGLYFYLDLWAFFGSRHEFCLAKSRFGSFAPSFHRHEMAVRACKVWRGPSSALAPTTDPTSPHPDPDPDLALPQHTGAKPLSTPYQDAEWYRAARADPA